MTRPTILPARLRSMFIQDFSRKNPLVLGKGATPSPLLPVWVMPLAYFMAISSLKREATQTFLGFLWWIINPLIYVVIYYFLAVVIFSARGEGYIPFLIVGLFVWRWTALAVQAAGASIYNRANLIRQIYIPKPVFPLAAIIDQTIKFLVSLVVLIVALYFFGIDLTYSVLYLPVLVLIQLALILGLGYVLSVIIPIVPDIRNLVGFIFQAGVFLSGILWGRGHLPEKYHLFLDINPMATLIEAYRAVLLMGQAPDFGLLWPTPVVFGILLVGGLIALARLDRLFPKFIV
jgi:ABC-type polysaccharide/polyol phosphate export permease